MIYRRNFYAEATLNAAALVAILGGIFLLVWLGRLLAEQLALTGTAMLNLILLQVVRIMPQLLTVALFAGLVITFNRMVQTYEYTAWAVAGVRERNWQRAVLLLALPTAVTVALLALHGVPWAIRFTEQYQRQLSEQAKIEDSAPGLFSELPAQNLVFHLDAVSPDRQSAIGIFIARQQHARVLQLVTAKRADTEIDAGGLRSLHMEQGRLHVLDFDRRTGTRVSFANAALDIGAQGADRQFRLRARALEKLGTSHGERVEYWWRISFPFSLILLCLLALPLGQLSPGTGRGYQALLATLLYWLYYACAGLAKDYGLQQVLPPPAAGLGPLLLPLGALGGVYLLRRARL